MQKIGRASAQVAGRFLFLGVSVQILLGICWGVRSFGIFPEFGDSYTWLKASETLVCDDYMGIGYPLFLMLVKGIESISSIPYTFFCIYGTDPDCILCRCSIFTGMRSDREKDIFVLGKPGASDLSLCHAKSSGRIAEFPGIFPFTAGTVGGDPDPAAGCCGGGW